MPDALNHLSAFNRIAYALEHMPPDDQEALIAAIEAIANKTIPVADLSGVVTAINNKTIPATDLTGVVTAINNISISGGGGAGSGSLDCSCLADVLAPLVEKLDQMICVIVPIANSQHQIEKIINYWMQDGPQYGLDAPPGSFIFPIPNDSAPSLPYTPTPTPTPTNPSTGAWTAPPIIDGVYYVAPPGGMLGGTDLATYEDYKCNVANFIFDYLMAWMDWLDKKGNEIGVGMLIQDATLWVISAIRWLMAAHGLMAATSATGGVSLVKVGATAGAVVMSGFAMLAFTGSMIALAAELYFANRTITDWITVLTSAKQDIICALWKAKTTSAAREGVMTAITNRYTLYYSSLPDFLKEGTMGRLTRYVLDDNLLANLFACQDGWNAADFGVATTPCTECMLCKDMDEAILVNKKSIYGYPNPGDIRTGLVPYPITVDLGMVDTDVICLAGRAEWINGGAIVKIAVNGGAEKDYSWGGFTPDLGALENMPFKESMLYPQSPETRFTGHVVMKIYNEGATVVGYYEVQTVSWRLPA